MFLLLIKKIKFETNSYNLSNFITKINFNKPVINIFINKI